MSFPPQTADSSAALRRVEGHIERGTRKGPLPVGNQWVVLHRVGPDRAGPLDSVRTDASGRYALRYRASGDSTALYFASTSYGGVAYFTSPLRALVVKGDDALITVFDTTSGPVAVKIGGRHLVVGAPQANGRRPIGEVYDLENDSTVTVISRDSVTPVWFAHLPAAAVGFQLNTNGDLAAGAVTRRGSTVGLFAPVSPGIRQVAFTYELPADAFPLSVPAERPTGVFELLVQEPSAKISGIPIREMAPVSTDGRIFRRFLAQDLEGSSVARIDLPRMIGAEREKVYLGVALTLLAAMTLALVFAARRSTPKLAFARRVRAEPSPAEALLRAIADLDADFERGTFADDDARAGYETKRAALKAELSVVLAASRRRA
ncbi:MAG: hypothetical protein JWM41_2405 [Gemmatimonadetes bacterium]|nr:hypothetical protein [Gemmatimonadota bacterium]